MNGSILNGVKNPFACKARFLMPEISHIMKNTAALPFFKARETLPATIAAPLWGGFEGECWHTQKSPTKELLSFRTQSQTE